MAAKYCEQGAKANNPKAFACLGNLYQTGQGMQKSAEMAAHWYGKAARCGDKNSIYRMSQLYGSGEGVKQDRIRQYALLLMAGRLIPQAMEEAVKIQAELNEKDLRKVEKEILKFRQNIDRSCAAVTLH